MILPRSDTRDDLVIRITITPHTKDPHSYLCTYSIEVIDEKTRIVQETWTPDISEQFSYFIPDPVIHTKETLSPW